MTATVRKLHGEATLRQPTREDASVLLRGTAMPGMTFFYDLGHGERFVTFELVVESVMTDQATGRPLPVMASITCRAYGPTAEDVRHARVEDRFVNVIGNLVPRYDQTPEGRPTMTFEVEVTDVALAAEPVRSEERS